MWRGVNSWWTSRNGGGAPSFPLGTHTFQYLGAFFPEAVQFLKKRILQSTGWWHHGAAQGTARRPRSYLIPLFSVTHTPFQLYSSSISPENRPQSAAGVGTGARGRWVLRYPGCRGDPGSLTALVLKALKSCPLCWLLTLPSTVTRAFHLSLSAVLQANYFISILPAFRLTQPSLHYFNITPPFASERSSAKSPSPFFVFVGLIFIPLLSFEWDLEQELTSLSSLTRLIIFVKHFETSTRTANVP